MQSTKKSTRQFLNFYCPLLFTLSQPIEKASSTLNVLLTMKAVQYGHLLSKLALNLRYALLLQQSPVRFDSLS